MLLKTKGKTAKLYLLGVEPFDPSEPPVSIYAGVVIHKSGLTESVTLFTKDDTYVGEYYLPQEIVKTHFKGKAKGCTLYRK